MRLYQALGALSEALTAAAAAKEALSTSAKDCEWAHEDGELEAALDEARAAMNGVLAAYAAAIATADTDPLAHSWLDVEGRFVKHLRCERRYVARLDSRVLAHLAKCFRELAADVRDVPHDDDDGSPS